MGITYTCETSETGKDQSDDCDKTIENGTLRVKRKQVAWLAASLMLLASMLPTTAVATDSDKWEYDATIYLWGAAIDATTQTGGDIDLSFSDIIKDLDMTFMGSFGAHKGKWSLLADAIYMDLSQSDSGSETIPVLDGAITINKTVDTDVTLKAWITTFGAGYNVINNERAMLDLIGGARYLYLDVGIKLDLGLKGSGGQLNTSRKEKVSESDHVWDGIVGVRGRINLDNNWYLPYYADIGTGGSESTWQLLAGVGYQFKWGDVLLAYRYLDYNFDSDFLLDDMNISGLALGARFRF
jgi:opacity protein-like surface antigen